MKLAVIYVKADDQNYDYSSLQDFIDGHDEWIYVRTYKDYYGNDPIEHDELIDSALNGEVDVIVTDSVAKFGRNKKQFVDNMKSLMSKKVIVFFRQEQICSDDPHFPDVINVITAFLEDQAELRAEKRRK